MFALINKASLEYLLTKYEGMSPEAVREVIQRVALSEDVTLCKDCIHHREPGRCVLHSLGGDIQPHIFLRGWRTEKAGGRCDPKRRGSGEKRGYLWCLFPLRYSG